MKQKISVQQKKLNLLLDNVSKRFKTAWYDGRYEDALGLALQATRMAPMSSLPWSDAAACFVYLYRWDEAIEYATRAVSLGERGFGVFDALSHAHGLRQNWAEVRKYGLLALQTRDNQFGNLQLIQWDAVNVKYPAPSIETKFKNIISFSLFGSNSRYCEAAVLNAKMQQTVYPNWTCYFYIDNTVPHDVVERIKSYGGVVVVVENDLSIKIPGPMWRFFAYDLPEIHRVIFRDADSVINERESAAVNYWVDNGCHFHHMRDSPTHTELLLAGMWGVLKGSLPTMSEMIDLFLKKPISSRHFADQFFLREFVWPYAKQSLLQHDSMFGFYNAIDFPDTNRPLDWNVGCDEGGTSFSVSSSQDDGTRVTWTLEEVNEDNNWVKVCSYESIVQNKNIDVMLPKRYYKNIIEKKSMRIMTTKIS